MLKVYSFLQTKFMVETSPLCEYIINLFFWPSNVSKQLHIQGMCVPNFKEIGKTLRPRIHYIASKTFKMWYSDENLYSLHDPTSAGLYLTVGVF